MATLDDIRQAYLDTLGFIPGIVATYDENTVITDQMVSNIYAAYGTGTAPTTTTTTSGTSAPAAYNAGVESQMGQPPGTYSDRTTYNEIYALLEAAGGDLTQAERITREINEGTRSLANVTYFVDRIAQRTGTAGTPTAVESQMGQPPGTFTDTITPEEYQRLWDSYKGKGLDPGSFDRIFTEINNGERSLANVTYWFNQITGGPVGPGDTVIPAGATLIIVNDPTGSDAARLYYLAYEWNGVTLTFEVGDQDRFEELFGTTDYFDTVQTFTQTQFDQQDLWVSAGFVDELLGQEETVTSMIERSVADLGMEDLPDWIMGDVKALALIATATGEGWSSGRLWQELSGLDSFQQRFLALDVYLQQNVTVAEAVSQYVADETALRSVLARWRPGQQFGTEYLADLIGKGWSPDAASDVLEVEAYMLRNPDALAQANLVLVASGFDPVDETGLANIMRGAAAPDVIEALNTAAAAQAIADAGIDLDDETVRLLIDVVDDFSVVRSSDDFQRIATDLALNLIRNRQDLDFARYGLGREDLIAAAFGEESPSGKGTGEVVNALAKLERERKAAASGFDDYSAFIDQEDRLRIQGLGNI